MCGCSENCSARRCARTAAIAASSTVERVRALSKASRAGDGRPIRRAGVAARTTAGRIGDPAGARLHALPEPRERRRAASPHPPPPCVPRGAGLAAAARFVPGDVCAACSGRASLPTNSTRRSARCASSWCSRRIRPRCRGGRSFTSTTASRNCSRERDPSDLTVPERDEVIDALRREIVVGLGDRRSPSRSSIAARRSPRRTDRVRAESLARGATCSCEASTPRCVASRGADFRSTRRRCASGRGLAATATATRT